VQGGSATTPTREAPTIRFVPLYVIWFGATLALLVLELASTTFFAIFLAAGTAVAGIFAFLVPDSPWWAQAILAIVVAMAGVILVRPFVSQRLRRSNVHPLTPGVHGGFVGQRALPLDEIGDELHPGHVRLAGETWLAISEHQQTIPAGVAVEVTAVRGTTLVVRPVAEAAAVPAREG
jgi:membrane protein implicated in regulation of membrane protease activity